MNTPFTFIKNTAPCCRNAFKAKRFGAVSRDPSAAVFKRLTSGTSNSAQRAPPPPSLLRNPLRWYASKLDTHPLTTKCLTSGAISGAGDALCQYLAPHRGDGDDDPARRRPDDRALDRPRTLRFALLGACLVAPTVHVWYGFLLSRFPGAGVAAVARRLFCDQALFAPVFLPAFISCLTVLEHVSPDVGGDGGAAPPRAPGAGLAARVRTRLRDDVPDALVVGWSLWIPAMGVMFAVVPGKFQVLFSNGVGFFWNAYLSWRTHEGEGDGRDGRGGGVGVEADPVAGVRDGGPKDTTIQSTTQAGIVFGHCAGRTDT